VCELISRLTRFEGTGIAPSSSVAAVNRGAFCHAWPERCAALEFAELWKRCLGRFAKKQMYVVGHEDVADQRELKLCAHLSERLEEKIFGVGRLQVRAAVVTTEVRFICQLFRVRSLGGYLICNM
jgi:hypothetical protein